MSSLAALAQQAFGPLSGTGDHQHPYMGWVAESGTASVGADNKLTVVGDSRVYLVNDHREVTWERHQYQRLDLQASDLRYELDLSKVPCGCLACVYLVAMADPGAGATESNYCGAPPLACTTRRPTLEASTAQPVIDP